MMNNQKLPARVAALIVAAAHNSAAADRLAAKEAVHAELPARIAALIAAAAHNSTVTDRLAAKVGGFDEAVRTLANQVRALEATMAGRGRPAVVIEAEAGTSSAPVGNARSFSNSLWGA